MAEKTIKILLVEDNEDYRKIAMYMLEKMDMPVFIEHVYDLATGFTKIDQGGIDIILLDLNLPDSKGLETVDRMLKKAPKIPIVVMTADNDKNEAVAAVKAGAQDFLVKGDYDSRLLNQAIRYALAREAK